MKSEDFKENKNVVKLYQNVNLSSYLTILIKYKTQIKSFNNYVLDFLEKNKTTDIRNSALTIYCEKINQIYHEKSNSFFQNLYSALLITGTFLMVWATFRLK
ncbi:hypothetical protein [Leptospira vanthielii]|uniref:Uncharacterized protein n=1 Tax=Leptospira vanthielii TaxID=293085 RepID=A0ABY2NU53_9LEPT|nr:hypothetical protein [Leptospira vanthielii]TGM61796.1 hypothetical protein EHQ95_00060 [Leptospira vanthielii]